MVILLQKRHKSYGLVVWFVLRRFRLLLILLIILCLYYWFIIPGGQAHKRRRTSEPIEIEDRLESLICRVGEKVKCQLHQLLSHRNLTQCYLYQHFNACTLQALNDYLFFSEYIFT